MVSAQTTLRQGWLARAVLSGFVATVLMILAAVVAYGIAYVLANIEPSEQAGTQTYSAWFKGLTDNIIVEYTTDVFYAAIAIHLAIGLGLCPYLRVLCRAAHTRHGPRTRSRLCVLPVGTVPGGIPAARGCRIFRISAWTQASLPILGNLVLHIVYGAALGLIYGSFGDTVDAENPDSAQATAADTAAMGSSERMAARGIVAGIVGGAAIGLIAAAIAGISGSSEMMNLPLAAFVLVSAVMGGTVGALIGSLVGLEQSTA